MSRTDDKLLLAAINNADRIAERLKKSLLACASFTPLANDSFAAIGDDGEQAIDAFLKRWEQLQDTLSNRVLRALLNAFGDDTSAYNARSAFDRAAALGAIGDANAFFDRHILRNRLAHEYPEGDARRISRINDAFAAAPALLADLATIKRLAETLAAKEP